LTHSIFSSLTMLASSSNLVWRKPKTLSHALESVFPRMGENLIAHDVLGVLYALLPINSSETAVNGPSQHHIGASCSVNRNSFNLCSHFSRVYILLQVSNC
jgi:hypothetical protein